MKKVLGPIAVLVGLALVTWVAMTALAEPPLEPGTLQFTMVDAAGDPTPCRATLYQPAETGGKRVDTDSTQACDEHGRLTWTGREPGAYQLMAMQDGAAMLKLDVQLAEGPGLAIGPLQFSPGGRVFGVVTQDGAPVSGAQVRVTGGGNGLTNAAGQYRIDGVAVGDLEVRAGLGVYGAARSVELVEGQTVEVALELQAVASLGQVGVQLADRDGGVFIEKIRPGWPAELVLRPDDRLLEVNGQAVSDRTQAKALMAGEPGEPLTLLVQRGDEPKQVELVRASAEPEEG